MKAIVDRVERLREHDGLHKVEGLSWEDYCKVSESDALRHGRLTYFDGSISFHSITANHGRMSGLWTQFIIAATDHFGLTRRCCSDMSWQRPDRGAAIEPDGCFYLSHEPMIRGRRQLDPVIDPPPDLALEIDIDLPQRDRRSVYQVLEYPEVWRVLRDRVQCLVLSGGKYVKSNASRAFPALHPSEFLPFAALRFELDEASIMNRVRAFLEKKAIDVSNGSL